MLARGELPVLVSWACTYTGAMAIARAIETKSLRAAHGRARSPWEGEGAIPEPGFLKQ